MYSLCVVVFKPCAQLGLLGRERNAPVPVVPDAFFLDRSVKPLNVSVVIGSVEPTVSRWYGMPRKCLFKIPSVLWAIVGLY